MSFSITSTGFLLTFLLVNCNLTAAEPLSNRIDAVELPGKVLGYGVHVLGLPFRIPSKLFNFFSNLILRIEHFGLNEATAIIKLLNQAGNALLDILVDVGVLGGKTAEDVITFIVELVMKVVKTIWKTWTKTANFIADHLIQVVKKFRTLKDLAHFIETLPVIKVIPKIISPVKAFIQETFKNQTQLTVKLIHDQLEKHSDFFGPIVNGTATRILIISNALQALVDGNLEECAGNVNLGYSPIGSLTWKVDLLINKFKVVLLRLLGLSKLADSLEIDTNAGFSKIPFGSAK